METMDNNQKELSMGWYKFIIYIALILSPILHVYGAFRSFTGMIYGDMETAKIIYYIYPSLKTIDVLMAVAEIGLAVFCIVVRKALVDFKTYGPKLLYAMMIVGTVTSLLYGFAVISIIDIMELQLSDIVSMGSLAGNISMLVINIIYFNNRKHMFVN